MNPNPYRLTPDEKRDAIERAEKLQERLAADRGEPYAEVSRVGRRTWWITVNHGIMSWGPDGSGWHCWGSRERADRKAARMLARYRRSQWTERHRIEAQP